MITQYVRAELHSLLDVGEGNQVVERICDIETCSHLVLLQTEWVDQG